MIDWENLQLTHELKDSISSLIGTKGSKIMDYSNLMKTKYSTVKSQFNEWPPSALFHNLN